MAPPAAEVWIVYPPIQLILCHPQIMTMDEVVETETLLQQKFKLRQWFARHCRPRLSQQVAQLETAVAVGIILKDVLVKLKIGW
jgi:hypothetical protein